jgi:hypothetical protein
VPRAVEIAQHQGWVSPHRLMTQAHLTKSAAQSVLRAACGRLGIEARIETRTFVGAAWQPLRWDRSDRVRVIPAINSLVEKLKTLETTVPSSTAFRHSTVSEAY